MRHHDYTVGWICALQTEYVVACQLLDEEEPLDEEDTTLAVGSFRDNNAYTLGRIGEHHVVIACLPKGIGGIASAATVAKDMLRSFQCIRIGLFVGIGGGAPSDKHDIRLGDIVVGCPKNGSGGVIHYDFGKVIQDQAFKTTGSLNSPPTVLLTALMKLSANHERIGSHYAESAQAIFAENPRLKREYQHPGAEYDRLYEPDSKHRYRDQSCDTGCAGVKPSLLQRPQREVDPNEPVVHYGLIASADKVIKDAILRDQLSKHYDVLCFETEAAGLMNNFPCVVIRGISKYSDSHKNDAWQAYAALMAALYAKELLCIIRKDQIASAFTATTEIFNLCISRRTGRLTAPVIPISTLPFQSELDIIDQEQADCGQQSA